MGGGGVVRWERSTMKRTCCFKLVDRTVCSINFFVGFHFGSW